MSGCPVEHGAFNEFDHHSAAHREGAEARWSELREHPGLARSEKYGGFYIVTRHADLRKSAAQHGTFSSAMGVALPNESRSRHIPEEVDPPLHREYRRLLDPFLTPAAVAKLQPRAESLAVELLDRFKGAAGVEIVQAFTAVYPVYFALDAFGFPAADAQMLAQLVERLISGRGTEDGKAAGAALSDYLVRFLATKAATAKSPSDDIIAAIALGSVNGRPLELEEQVSMTRLLLFGGFTTVNLALSYALYLMAVQPELATALHADAQLMTSALEELIRLSSPGTYLRRTLTADAELGGEHLKAGDQVLLCFGAANRDPAMFERADEVLLDRNPNPHLGFGFGPHRCMGAMLAKLEMRVALRELLVRYERFELAPGQPLRWGSGETQGLESLPLILHPRS